MKQIKFVSLLCLLACLMTTTHANVVWNWSFGSEAGQFMTDGNPAASGTYTLLNFSVVSSGSGGTIGSLRGGEYGTDNDFSTYQPFSFYWDGSSVRQWLHAGLNTFDWWAFSDTTSSADSMYFFGWDTNNINDPTRGAHWDGDNFNPLAVGDIAVYAVPVPAAVWLFGSGLIGILRVTRAKSKVPAISD